MRVQVILSFWFVQHLTWSEVKCTTPEECKALSAKVMKDYMKIVTDCTASIKFKDAKEKKQKSSCIMKCVMTKAGFLDANGLVDIDAAVKLLSEMVPEDMYAKVERLLRPCEGYTKQIVPNDEFCKSYDPMIKCGTQALTQVCK